MNEPGRSWRRSDNRTLQRSVVTPLNAGDVVVVGRLGAQEVERLVRSQPRLPIMVTIGHIMKQLASAFATPFEDSGAVAATEEDVRRRWVRN